MEVTNFTNFLTKSSKFPPISIHSLNSSNYRFNFTSLYPNCFRSIKTRRKPLRICNFRAQLNDCINGDPKDLNSNVWEDRECVEVIGIGSRVDSVLDFCLNSLSVTSRSLRFWNILRSESQRGQLHQRLPGKDAYANIVEVPSNQQTCFKAVVLVASAGYGDEYVITTDILRSIKSGGGLAIAVILKPFSFEGQRRQDEVKILADQLKDCVSFCIDIDIDTLLKMDLVTLDEALKSAYKAVFSAISAVSILVSETHKKHIHSLHDNVRQVTVTEAMKVLENYTEGKVGFGVGQDVQSSIAQAVYDCPFLSIGLKDLEGIVICIISSSYAIGDNDVASLVHTFHQATECTKEVILSIVEDPEMSPNLIATTVITVCVAEKKYVQRSSLLSRLADSIPFVFNFLRRHQMQSSSSNRSNLRENLFPPMLENLVDGNDATDVVPFEGKTDIVEPYTDQKMPSDGNFDEEKHDDDGTGKNDHFDANGNQSKYMYQNFEGGQVYDKDPVINRDFRSDFRSEEMDASENSPIIDSPRIFHLPVGVKSSDDMSDFSNGSNRRRPMDKRFTDTEGKTQSSDVSGVPSLNVLAGVGFETVTDFWNSASTIFRGKPGDNSRKQGVLSARAASMLEVERNSKTKWSPVMEIRYKGGRYKGRCQGGLPEGRGRLTFMDGSVYDGMWRYGKRSGLGSLFFSNGDVFHGSWRDDLMHGKGWLYFHSGERWFANFWKGRANGEGRFYSSCGEVSFGHFQDGWRHGHSLCVKVDGTRYVELWDEGVLVSSEEMDISPAYEKLEANS